MSSIIKPSGCIGCPFERYGKYFVPDKVIPNSRVYFLAQNPGEHEEKGIRIRKRKYIAPGIYDDDEEDVSPQPLIGPSGKWFREMFLPLSGLTEDDVSLGNAIRCRPGKALGLKPNDLPTITTKMNFLTSRADIVKALRHCKEAYFHPPKSTELIVTMGSYALYQLTGEKSVIDMPKSRIYGWRGFVLPLESYGRNDVYFDPIRSFDDNFPPVFSTMHPAALYRPTGKRFIRAVMQDFGKIKRILNKQWPLPLPEYQTRPPEQWPSYSSFDTEFTTPETELYQPSDTGELIRWSLCDSENNLYVVEAPDSLVIPVAEGSTVLDQNILADYRFLKNVIDVSKIKLEDLMLADSVLHTGEPHGLNFIQSIYGAFNKYKHLNHGQPQLYSALDAYEPMYCWRFGLIPLFRRDKLSWRAYKEHTLTMVSIINKAHQHGIPLDIERIRSVKQRVEERISQLQERAREITGDSKFNLGGYKKVSEHIYGPEDESLTSELDEVEY